MYQHPKAGPPLDEDLDQVFDYNSFRLGLAKHEDNRGLPQTSREKSELETTIDYAVDFSYKSQFRDKPAAGLIPQDVALIYILPLTQTYDPLNKRDTFTKNLSMVGIPTPSANNIPGK